MTHVIPHNWDGRDVFDVIGDDGIRIGQIGSSVDGWAAYEASPHGVIKQERIGTFQTVAEAKDVIVGKVLA